MKKLILLAVLFSLSTSLNAQEKPEQKAKFQTTYNNSKVLVETQQYQFVGDWIFYESKREKLESNSSTISINKSNISGQLVGVTENLNRTINDYHVSFDDENQRISITFNIKSHTIALDIKPNGNTFLTVVSNKGNKISYRGLIK